ncbi:hypothetical protein LNTAR_05654 [Lentisphaera araneosa HTCC2155]|uniref:Uncharacterized protein n=1 Tax=Lentisphaera araneosa HTCC2155 TaxID=313628 RepID=A6DPD9_9BACT|nr:hypothetical protein LNTAR_05654 [Lentisphaera araneosa HTCC2155]
MNNENINPAYISKKFWKVFRFIAADFSDSQISD